jgi:predicted RNA-binding protein with TRAM domain
MKFFNKPVEEGLEYEVTIGAQGNKGDGIAHIEGFVVFVNGAKTGETVKVRINSVRRTFAIGEVVK